MNKKEQKILSAALAVVFVVTAAPSMTSAMGPGGGMMGGMGQAMRDENGTPIGLQDEDGDGILNKDDDDFEKPMKNARDNDGDSVPNKIDEDYVPTQDGAGRPETAGNRAGQVNSNKPETMGEGQVNQGTSPAKERMNAPTQDVLEQKNENRIQQRMESRGVDTNEQNEKVRAQLRTMTQEREQVQQAIADDVVKLQNQNKFRKMFVGSDDKIIEHAQTQLNVYEQKIDVLKQISANATNPDDKMAAEAQISQMEEMHAKMENLVVQNSEGFSLVGWVKNLFN